MSIRKKNEIVVCGETALIQLADSVSARIDASDAENGDPLDNRRCNLRLCSHGENMCNRKPNRAKANGYKGVKIDARTGRHTARIQVDGRQIHLGVFDDAESAARAYDTAAVAHHGEFARLNSIGS